MKKAERRQDGPPPTDPGAWPQQAFESQPPASAPPDLPPKNDATRPDDPNRQREPPVFIPEDRDRDQTKQRPYEDRGKQRAPPAEYVSQDSERTRQRLPVPEDRGRQRAPPESPLEDRERTRQRPPAPQDQGRQLAPPGALPEDRSPNSTKQRPLASGDRGKGRAPAELLQSPQYSERSPLFTRPSSPHPAYAAAGPSRGYDAYNHRRHSPTDPDDIVLTDNRTQPKPGFWARLTGAMRDRGDPEPEDPGHTHVRGRLPPQPVHPNVILFGSHGAGKSSLVNMLAGKEASSTSDRGLAAFANGGYLIDLGGKQVVLWDVLGLDKGDGTREHDAISEDVARNLHFLIQRLQGGVNLLVHCINAKHPNEAVQTNYEAFYRIIGGKKVPIVLVVTGLEDEDPMERWWKQNEAEIKNLGMTYDGHACITTIRGKPLRNGQGHQNEEQYEQSRLAVRELIKAKLNAAVIIREEGKLAELRGILREQNERERVVSQNGNEGKDAQVRGRWVSREVNSGNGSTQNEQLDDDTTDRIEREGRTASLALLGGLLAVFVVLHSGITSCM